MPRSSHIVTYIALCSKCQLTFLTPYTIQKSNERPFLCLFIFVWKSDRMDTSQLKLKTILPQSQVNQVKTLEKSFIYTVFVEPKGKMVLKAKCRACNYVLNNNNVEKLMHW